MAKLKQKKTKNDYVDELSLLVHQLANQLTVKQIRTLIARYAPR
jgi:hypothetical protein